MTYVPVSTMWELQRLHEGSLDIGLFGSGGTIVVRVGWSTVMRPCQSKVMYIGSGVPALLS